MKGRTMSLLGLVLVVIVILLFTGGLYGGPHFYGAGPYFGGGGLGLIFVIVLVLILFGRI